MAFSDFAVLYRTESQAAVLVEALQRSGMPFQQRSHDRLLDPSGVAGLTEALRARPAVFRPVVLVTGSKRPIARLQQTASTRSQSDEAAHAYSLLKPSPRLATTTWTASCPSWPWRARLTAGTPAPTDFAADLHAAKGLDSRWCLSLAARTAFCPCGGKSRVGNARRRDGRRTPGLLCRRHPGKTKLYLSRARKRRWRGKIRELPPSPLSGRHRRRAARTPAFTADSQAQEHQPAGAVLLGCALHCDCGLRKGNSMPHTARTVLGSHPSPQTSSFRPSSAWVRSRSTGRGLLGGTAADRGRPECRCPAQPDGRLRDRTPAPFNARTRVHEYGGGACVVHRGSLYFSNFADQRVYRQQAAAAPEPITPDENLRYADGEIDPHRNRLVCVRKITVRPTGKPSTPSSLSLSTRATVGCWCPAVISTPTRV